MTDLLRMKCVPCRGGEPALTPEQMAALLPEVPEWRLIDLDGVKRIERVLKFPDFKAAIAFTNRVAEVAESEDHHPLIITEWGKVTVQWWTHKIGGLHRNDFIMAAKTDHILVS